jgi:hypothetical protein
MERARVHRKCRKMHAVETYRLPPKQFIYPLFGASKLPDRNSNQRFVFLIMKHLICMYVHFVDKLMYAVSHWNTYSTAPGKKASEVCIRWSENVWPRKNSGPGEPLWLSGKVMEWENKRNQINGFAPQPGQPKWIKQSGPWFQSKIQALDFKPKFRP